VFSGSVWKRSCRDVDYLKPATESNEEARDLDMRLGELWSKHPNFHFVPHSTSFFAKLQDGLGQLQRIVDENGLLRPDS